VQRLVAHGSAHNMSYLEYEAEEEKTANAPGVAFQPFQNPLFQKKEFEKKRRGVKETRAWAQRGIVGEYERNSGSQVQPGPLDL